MSRIATPRPAYCASCYAHKDEDFVDFEAMYDGPTIPGTPDFEMTIMSDLVICNECIEDAARLLDLAGQKATIEELVAENARLQSELDSKDKTIRGAIATIAELSEHPLAKFPGKPPLVGLTDEQRAEVTRKRYERNGTSPAPKGDKEKVTA